MATTVAVIESRREDRCRLAESLNRSSRFHCTGGYAEVEEAARDFGGGAPDLLLLDLSLARPGSGGEVGRLKRLAPPMQIVLLVSEEEAGVIVQALSEGAAGYVGREESWPRLAQVLEEVARGGTLLSSRVARKLVERLQGQGAARLAPESLSWREREILEGLAQGYPYKQIAAVLGISLDTVRTYVRRLYAKLQVRSRAHAVLKCQSG